MRNCPPLHGRKYYEQPGLQLESPSNMWRRQPQLAAVNVQQIRGCIERWPSASRQRQGPKRKEGGITISSRDVLKVLLEIGTGDCHEMRTSRCGNPLERFSLQLLTDLCSQSSAASINAKSPTQCAGLNRPEAGNGRVLQERISEYAVEESDSGTVPPAAINIEVWLFTRSSQQLMHTSAD